jgi:hypothetical protein
MKIQKIAIAILSIFFVCTSVFATDLPSPPNGYSWVECKDIKGAFLKPSGWFFKQATQGDTIGYFITKENIEALGSFETGLSVNVIPDIPRKKQIQASNFAAAYIKTAIQNREVFKKPWSTSMGPFEAYGVVLINHDSKQGDFVTHNLAIANDQTGTLYLLTFESPLNQWNSSWEIAEPMLKMFLIDDTI